MEMPNSQQQQQHRRHPSITTVFLLIAGLYFAREFLIPFALAFLVAPAVAPPIALLERWRLGRVPSVLIVVFVACAVLGVTVWLLTQQLADLVTRMPEYKAHIIDKLDSLRGGMFERAKNAVDELGAGIATSTGPSHVAQPQEVRVVPNALGDLGALLGSVGLLFGPLGTLGIVLLIVTFLLLQRGDLRDRVIHLIGEGKVNLTTQAMTEISSRVSKYLRIQATLNSIHGIVVGVGLHYFGVPNALVWGILAALLRYIPYIGPLAATVMPFVFSLAVFDGWPWPLMVAGFLVTVELLTSNVVEPLLYGSSTGVSPLAVIVSTVFWAWMWGPVGMVMAMPLTVALVVIGKHVPQLHFLNELLGEGASSLPSVRVYQRLLAMNQSDLSDIAERELVEQGSFVQLCDAVLIPAIGMAEFDRHHGALQDFNEVFIEGAMREVIEDLGQQARKLREKEESRKPSEDIAPGAPIPAVSSAAVLCIPANRGLGQIVGLMLSQVLDVENIPCRVAAVDALTDDHTEGLSAHSTDIVCISALPPAGLVQARYMARRLRANFPEIQLIVGVWGSELKSDGGLLSIRSTGPTTFVTTLAAARDQIKRLVALPTLLEPAEPSLARKS